MGIKVAIIEDDLAIAQMYRMKLEKSGYDVEAAHDGVNGLELLKVYNPKLVLLDLMMPEMNGYEVLRKIRKSDWGKDIKVIILTNVSRDEAPKDLDKLGVEDYIIKANQTPTQVIETVEKVLAQKNN